jgi:hypothetical protein
MKLYLVRLSIIYWEADMIGNMQLASVCHCILIDVCMPTHHINALPNVLFILLASYNKIKFVTFLASYLILSYLVLSRHITSHHVTSHHVMSTTGVIIYNLQYRRVY